MTVRALLFLFVGCAAVAGAYPPAPDDTLYGTVRDERGRVLAKGAAWVIVSNDAGEIVRTPIDLAPEEGVNYVVHVPMDSGTVGANYTPTALQPTVGFTLRILMGGQSYVPFQITRLPPTVGLPGTRTRLDLTLGLDSDNDGLPDAWEQALIDNDRTGRLRTLADVKPGDDLDGDGLTNELEYRLGTYALDPLDGLALTVVEAVNGFAHLRFAVTVGRTYTIKASSDLTTWAAQSFSLGTAAGASVPAFAATTITVQDVWVPLPPGGTAFYRLYAR